MEKMFSFARWFGVPTAATGSLSRVWCIGLLLLYIFMVIGAMYRVINDWGIFATDEMLSGNSRSIVARISGSVFYGNALFSIILFWRLKSSWTRVLCEWCSAENTSGLSLRCDKNLRQKMILIITAICVLAAVEHTLSTITSIGLDCPLDLEQIFKRHILTSHAYLLRPSEYSLLLAIPIFVLSKTATFIWYFQDLVIILMSMGLTSRYRRLNDYVKHITAVDRFPMDAVKLTNSELIRMQTWRRIREAFVRQAALVRRVDGELGPLVLLSFSCSFYYICLEIFIGTGDSPELIQHVYYGVSLAWLCVRACAVMLAAADVHAHSTRAIKYLLRATDRGYNIEIKRLQQQLSNDFVALSGMGFFYVDRSLILEMAAAVIKYELVLHEFDMH